MNTRERLARAMYFSFFTGENPQVFWDKLLPGELKGWYEAIDAILDELMEPGKEALLAGRTALREGGLLPAYTDEGKGGQPPIMQVLLADAHRAIVIAIREGK